jgi:uncharacterized protein YuzE
MSIRIEQYDGGEVLYVALDPDGVWARSEFPDDLLTVDFNAKGDVIGIELIGSLARSAANAMVNAFLSSDALTSRAEVERTLAAIVA